jgi:serine/threonine-protein kinase
MGVVLLAENVGIGQKVAIKFVSATDEQRREEATARLLREARAAAGLRGEHVVRVYDVGESAEGVPFIVMELLEGLDLGEIIAKVSRLPISDAVGLLIQACRGVEEAHKGGIVHRDLKPSNLFVVRRQDGKCCLKVLDFGISKSLVSEHVLEPRTLTGSRMALGSPHYMSPEQVRDARNVDSRTDIWSLGVVLYQVLTGEPAFSAASFSGIFAAIATDTPASLRHLRPEIPAGLERVVLSCLERDPAARPQRVEQLRRELEPFCAKEPEFEDLLAAVADSSAGPIDALSETADVANVVLEHATRTQLSAGTPEAHLEQRMSPDVTRRSPSDGAAEEASPTRRTLVLVLAALSMLGLVLASRSFGEAKKELPPQSITLSFESHPSGARVREGERWHGTTPLEVQLAPAADRFPRTFTLELEGYRSYVFEHQPKRGSIRVLAELIPEAAPAIISKPGDTPAASAASVAPAANSKPLPLLPLARPSATAAPSPEPEIRLQR